MSGRMHAGVSWLKGCPGPQAGIGAWARSTLQGQETERAEVLRLGTVFCIQKATGTRIRLEEDVKEPWGWRSRCGQGPRPDWAGAVGGFQLTLQKASGAHEGTSGAATLSTRTDLGSMYKHIPISIQKAISALKKEFSSMIIIKFENFRYWC